MKIDEFDYELPKGTDCAETIGRRDVCRMMVLDRQDGTIEHKHFYDVIDYLNPGDCLVLNNSRYCRQGSSAERRKAPGQGRVSAD